MHFLYGMHKVCAPKEYESFYKKLNLNAFTQGDFADYAFLETFTSLLAHILYAFRAEMPRDMRLRACTDCTC